MNFTGALALHYLSKNHCSRPLSGKIAHELANAMRSGKFDASKAFIDLDEKDNLVGGQHVLSAIADTGIAYELPVRKGQMSYFPALILYTDKNEYVVVMDPKSIDNGRAFQMIQTRIEIK